MQAPTARSDVSASTARLVAWLRTSPRVLAGLAALAMAVVALLGYRGLHAGRVFPGVRAGDVSLGGLDRAAAEARLERALPAAGRVIALRDPADGRTWPFAPADLGIDATASGLADAALAAGRRGNPLVRLVAPLWWRVRPHELLAERPLDAARARATLADLAHRVDIAPVDAAIDLRGGDLVETKSVLGRQLDVEATLARLAALAPLGAATTVDLVVVPTAARVSDLSSVADTYRLVTSAPVELRWKGSARLRATREQLAAWASITATLPSDGSGSVPPAVEFDREAIRAWLWRQLPDVNREPQDARFRYDIDSGLVSVRRPGVPGILLDADASVQRVIDAAYTEQRVGELAVQEIAPAVPSSVLRELTQKVVRLASAGTSIAAAPPERLQNLMLVSDRFDGVALAPGATLSFLGILGGVSASAGYDVTHVAQGRPTLSGDYAGGIDQVATTAFRLAFWAGLPITARHAPRTRQAWVEPPIGMDAAVGAPDRDLAFVNDTPGYLLVQSELDTRRTALVWTLYGTGKPRRVEVFGPLVTALTPPLEPELRTSADAPRGTRTQVGWSSPGAAVTLERAVTASSGEVRRDIFTSLYEPGADIVVQGVGSP